MLLQSCRRSLVALALLALCGVLADEQVHRYTDGEPVILWLNKVGPYANPQESYPVFSLPYCKPEIRLEPEMKHAGIGQVLEGNEFINSDFDIKFNTNTELTTLCTVQLTGDEAARFRDAIHHHYWYQGYLDDLPVWGMVGEVLGIEEDYKHQAPGEEHIHEDSNVVVYTHRALSISHNGDQVIEVNLTSSNPVAAIEGQTLEFSFAVEWKETEQSFDSRFDRYLDFNFFEHQIHWFSVFNSFMMVIFLCGLVALILLRTLRNDFARYAALDDSVEGERSAEDAGWKQVHGDVFRKPLHTALFAAVLGSGTQLIVLSFTVTLVSIAGTLYVEHGGVTSAIIAIHALTSVVNGYVSGSYFARQHYPHPAPNWVRTMLMSACLYPVFLSVVGCVLNGLALAQGTIHALPLKSVLMLALLFSFVTVPLTVAGTILGRQWASRASVPCRVTVIPRPIPAKPWFSRRSLLIPMSGMLPFGAVFIELYFLLTSFWNYKFYYVYGFLLLMLAILFVVCICVTIVATYFLLNAEDYRWQWTSFLAAGSTGFYVLLYSIYYFLAKTSMHGILQTAFFFGYMSVFSFSLFLMCGTIGVFGASHFVHAIYRNVKVE